jgi:SAM-dependent methyltransferase
VSTYIFDNGYRDERERLAGLEAIYDPGTFRSLSDLGVGPGWRCWEVGAGGGSVAAWLSDRVGPTGMVLATDLDIRFVESLAADRPNLDARRHDVVVDELPAERFDLIHARMVLEHLPARECVLARLVEVLAPGGWLVIESIDFCTEMPNPALDPEFADSYTRLIEARARILADHGFDHEFARTLPLRFYRLGLTEIAAEGRAYAWTGGSVGARVWLLSTEQAAARLIERGYADQSDIDRLRQILADPSFAATSPLMMAARGRRPA